MKKHILLVIMVVLLVGVLLTGCDNNKITNDNSTVVWEEYHNEYFSLKYPAQWNMYGEDINGYYPTVKFTSEEVPEGDEDPEVLFVVVFEINNEEYPGNEILIDDFYNDAEAEVDNINKYGNVTNHRKTTINGKPAYRYEYILPASSDTFPYDAKVVDIEIYNEYNTFDIGFASKADKYDANIGIAEEMFKSFKWDDNENNDSTVVLEEHHDDNYSIKYPVEWNMANGKDDSMSLFVTCFSPEEISINDEAIPEKIPEVSFTVAFSENFWDNEISPQKFYEHMEEAANEIKESGDNVFNQEEITLNGKPAYRMDILSAPDDDIPFEMNQVLIWTYDKRNSYQLYYCSTIDKYDANIDIAEEMFKSFKW